MSQISLDTQKLPVKLGLGQLNKPMTRAQAQRYGDRNIPRDLKAAGFTCSVFTSDPEIHGGLWYRISYGKVVKKA
ncbi:hypothetical protein ACI2KR_06595 [Pseudomonas luteola]